MIKENKTYDSAFFYLTIKGDTLNPEELNKLTEEAKNNKSYNSVEELINDLEKD